MTPFLTELVDQARRVVHGCCALRGLPPVQVVADTSLPTLWAMIEDPVARVVVNPQRLRFVSRFAREYELSLWVDESLGERQGVTPLPVEEHARE